MPTMFLMGDEREVETFIAEQAFEWKSFSL